MTQIMKAVLTLLSILYPLCKCLSSARLITGPTGTLSELSLNFSVNRISILRYSLVLALLLVEKLDCPWLTDFSWGLLGLFMPPN